MLAWANESVAMMERFDLGDLQALAQETLTRAGVSDAAARIVARDVALSEVARDPDGGFVGLLRDIRRIRYGRLDPDSVPVIETNLPAIVQLDGAGGFASVALAQALPHVVASAVTNGLSMIRLRNVSEPGAMAAAMADLSSAGLAGLALRSGGTAYAVRPRATRITPLDPSAEPNMLSSLLALAPPITDHPLEGPIAQKGWLIGLDPAATGITELLGTLPQDSSERRPLGVSLEPELLAQIVTA